MIIELLKQTAITWDVAFIRLFLAFLMGILIGGEREIHNQPAGLRTHIIISIGACLLMILSIYIPQTFKNFRNGDPGRIAAQVVSGIGFLGAGAILRLGLNVKGLTTAATIWSTAAIGLGIGAGMYSVSIIAAILVLITLSVVDILEKKFFHRRFVKKLLIISEDRKNRVNEIIDILRSFNFQIKNMSITEEIEKKLVKLDMIVKIPKQVNIRRLYNTLNKLKGMKKIELES